MITLHHIQNVNTQHELQYTALGTKSEKLAWWQLYCPWRNYRFSLWQPTVPLVTTKLAPWPFQCPMTATFRAANDDMVSIVKAFLFQYLVTLTTITRDQSITWNTCMNIKYHEGGCVHVSENKTTPQWDQGSRILFSTTTTGIQLSYNWHHNSAITHSKLSNK